MAIINEKMFNLCLESKIHSNKIKVKIIEQIDYLLKSKKLSVTKVYYQDSDMQGKTVLSVSWVVCCDIKGNVDIFGINYDGEITFKNIFTDFGVKMIDALLNEL